MVIERWPVASAPMSEGPKGLAEPEMTTRVVPADARGVAEAAELLVAGGLVAFPTETVYGLGADAGSSAAVESVFSAKGRPSSDPLIVHVHDEASAEDLGDLDVGSGVARRLITSFWPGPLTVVVPRRGGVAPEVAPGDTVGLRCPAHPVALSLLETAGVPLAAPSANRFGRVSPTEAAHVVEELGGRIPLVLDGGATPLGVESTVVSVGAGGLRLLRPGAVPVEELVRVLGDEHLDIVPRIVGGGEAAAGPGMMSSHYVPEVPLVLTDGGTSVAHDLAAALGDDGSRVGVVQLPAGTEGARLLYTQLRALRLSDLDVAVVATVDPIGVGRAVNDRLLRAANGHIEPDALPGTIERIRARVGRA